MELITSITNYFNTRSEYKSLAKKNKQQRLRERLEELLAEVDCEKDIIVLDFSGVERKITISYRVARAFDELGWKIIDHTPVVITAEYLDITLERKKNM